MWQALACVSQRWSKNAQVSPSFLRRWCWSCSAEVWEQADCNSDDELKAELFWTITLP